MTRIYPTGNHDQRDPPQGEGRRGAAMGGPVGSVRWVDEASPFSGMKVITHRAGALLFDVKQEGGPAGEELARVYNDVRLVRDAGLPSVLWIRDT